MSHHTSAPRVRDASPCFFVFCNPPTRRRCPLCLASRLADAGGTDKQLMLLDIEALTSPDDVTSLLFSPKGWLCTAEHKSCQFTCT